jgi:hypothetical protein
LDRRCLDIQASRDESNNFQHGRTISGESGTDVMIFLIPDRHRVREQKTGEHTITPTNRLQGMRMVRSPVRAATPFPWRHVKPREKRGPNTRAVHM